MSAGLHKGKVASALIPPEQPGDDVRINDTSPALLPEEHAFARKSVWRAPADLAHAPGPEEVLPQFAAPGIRIECVSRRPINTLPDRVDLCREKQRTEGRLLASTFCHGGSLFLVFKRWPISAHPFPRST